MKKSLLSLILLATLASSVVAKPVSAEKARRVAENFFLMQTGHDTQLELKTLPASLPNLYLFANPGGPGFVLVSGDDCATPILAYSLSSPIRGDVNVNEWAMLQDYSDEIQSAVSTGFVTSAETASLWRRYASGATDSIAPSNSPVLPLLQTTWGGSDAAAQYRYYTPTINGQPTKVGCGAVAMAQVMKYHNWPDVGVGQYSYHDSVKVSGTYYHIYPSANFGTTYYNWNNMPNELSSSSSLTQIQAVALLMYHAGVAVQMQYRTTGSSSAPLSNGTLEKRCVENALKQHFKYSKNLHGVYRNAYSDTEWNALMLAEISASRPVIYRGSMVDGNGHIWVCDGVDANGLFHFNGGGGSPSGYYVLSAVLNYCFPNECAAIVGIEPELSSPQGSRLVQTAPNIPSFGTTSVRLASSNVRTASGSFNCNDTIVVEATATDTTRFVRWSDGVVFNVREEIVNSDVSYTAIFEKVEGDTLYYDNGCYVGIAAFRRNDTVRAHFGIKLPPAVTAGHDSLTHVMLYSHYTGPYSLFVHVGETAAQGNLALSQSVYVTRSMSWQVIQLQHPVPVDLHQPLWILFRPDSAGYSMPFAPSAGNANAYRYGYNYSGWNNNPSIASRYAWMVRGIFSKGDSAAVSAFPSDPFAGSVLGSGLYPYGSNVTLHALPFVGYRFSHWSDDSTANPRTLSATHDLSLTAFFVPDIIAPDTVLVHDTTTVIDTVNLLTHDTIFISVHDTTTVIDTVNLLIHDTIFISVHDTTYWVDSIYMSDTLYLTDTLYLADTLFLTDTIFLIDTVYRTDTIFIHDTIFIENTGIVPSSDHTPRIYQYNGQIVVDNATNDAVLVFDVIGRKLAALKPDSGGRVRFDAPASGTYFIRIGNLPSRKVVVIK